MSHRQSRKLIPLGVIDHVMKKSSYLLISVHPTCVLSLRDVFAGERKIDPDAGFRVFSIAMSHFGNKMCRVKFSPVCFSKICANASC